MQSLLWQPPVDLSAQEEQIVKRIQKARLFARLGTANHLLSRQTGNAFRSRQRGPFSQGILCEVALANAIHDRSAGTQCQYWGLSTVGFDNCQNTCIYS